MKTRSRKHEPVHSVTGVRDSLTADIRARQRRYVLFMGVRTLCFLAAVVTPSPWRWMLLGVAVVLPHIAVIVANGGREPTRDAPPPVSLPLRTQLSSEVDRTVRRRPSSRSEEAPTTP
ncbi:DUF3099 domain-containing protein [Sporichthya sp.]|uniref:DUF3099 domain-containing protein n=1 Tax=Sporichthya sp. TaxID=65475 RepID=UPI00181E778C|nr:DUF3099 domain-containing protein [Sporichthya sp.]MBA3742554.1 DUF3099 domain-containing protein [Sporichthya sp.]